MSSERIQTRIKIQTLHDTGMAVSVIAKQLGVDRKTVRKWINKPEGEVFEKSRSGRPKVLSPNSKKKIRRLTENKPGVGTRTVAKMLNFSTSYQNRDKKVSRRTVQRYIKSTEWGRHAYKQRIKPLLSQKNIRDRLKFCNRLQEEGFCEDTILGRVRRANILFTDESWIELHPKPNRQNKVIRTSDPSTIQTPKFDLKIMMAGGISSNGKSSLHIVEENKTVNGEYYRERIIPVFAECLKNNLQFPNRENAILMQDGARAHTAVLTIESIYEHFANVWLDFPGNSPDLNAIENVWSRLKDSVLRQPIPQSRNQLIHRVTEEWDSITEEELLNLCESFSKRIFECIENRGYHTKY